MAATARHEGVHPGDVPFVLTRTVDAPRDLVWKAWTEPKRLMEWWGPKGFRMKSAKVDLRSGGTFHYGMEMPDGGIMWGKFTYREIVPPQRLEFVVSFSDEVGGVTTHPMNPDWPTEILSTITFEGLGGKTKITVKWIPMNATALQRKTFEDGRPSMTGGWTGTLEKLDAYLAHAH